MNLDQIKYFVQIVNSGNLSSASKKLGVSQPALSKYVINLEKTLNSNLFILDKKKLQLTPSGKLFYDMCIRIINIQNNTNQSIDLILNRTEIIKVGASPYRGSKIFAEIYSQFDKKYPNIILDLIECYNNEGIEKLQNNEIDILLGTTHTANNTDFNKIIFCIEDVLLCVPSFHPLASLSKYENGEFSSINPSLFSQEKWIVLEEGSTLRSITENIFLDYKFSPKIAFSSKNINVVTTMLKNGIGVGFTLKNFADLNQKDVVYFSIDKKHQCFICVSYNFNHFLTDAEKYLIGLVMENDIKKNNYKLHRNIEAEELYSKFKTEKP